MNGVSNSAVSLAALLLVATAGLGLYLGYSRAQATPGGSADESTVTPTTAAVAAKTASPIPDSAPAPAAPDETFIRKIAREEVQAALHPRRAAPAASASDDSDDDDDTDADSHPAAAAAPAPPPAPPPAPQ